VNILDKKYQKGEVEMDKYLIETPHSARDCQMLVGQVYAMGYLYHFEWGCPDGVHSGWAIIDAESHEQARLAVPSFVRGKARIVRLSKFTGEMISHDKSIDQPGRHEPS
jgi:hypothetical protein